MSMDLPIGVKVDTGDSAAKAKAVEDQLHKTEDAGIAAGKAMDGLTGASRKASDALERERTSLQRTTQLHDQLTTKSSALVRSTESLAEAIRREQAMLDRIHGPARQYAQDLQVLDSLLDRNKISTAEYAEQVARLNREIEKTPAKGQANAPTTGERLGAVGALLPIAGPPAAVGTVLSIGRSMEEIHHEAEALEDRYTKLTNVALKFANDGRTVNAALDMQRQLASELRAELAPTMGLYDGVGDAVRNLGFTTKEQIALSSILGKEMVDSNKPVSDAAGLLQRLSVAFELGSGAGRQFKTILAEHPKLADAAAKAYGTNLAGIVKLVDEGKIRLPELTRAWLEHGGAITDEHAKRKKTHEQIRKEVIEDAEIAMNRGVPAMMAYSKELVEFDARMREVRAGGKPMIEVLGNITAEVAEQARKWAYLEERSNAVAAAWGVNGLLGAVDQMRTGLRQLAQVADESMGKFFDTGFGRALGNQQERARAMAEARKELGALKIEMDQGSLTAHEYRQRYQALMTTLNGGELPATIRLWNEIHGPQEQYRKSIDALDSLLKAHSITTDQYNAKLRQLQTAYLGFDPRRLLGEESPGDRARRAADADRAAQQAETELIGRLEHEASFTKIERYQAEVAQLNRLVDEGKLSLDAYLVARQKAFESAGGSGEASSDFSAPGVDFAGIKGNLSKSAKGIKENEDALADLRKEELKKTKEAINDVIKTVAPLGEALGKALRGGDNAAEDLLDTLTQVGFKLLELGAISAFGPAGGIGAGFLKGLLGGKHGFDHVIGGRSGVELPGFATGGDAMIGGPYRGTDKTLVAFWGTAGESLQVRTPDQRAAGGMGGPPQVIVRPIFQMPDMGKQIAEYFDGYGGEVAVREVQRRSRRSRRT